MPFEFQKQSIPEVILVKPKVFNDSRGFFMESYKASDFSAGGISVDFIQDNHSKSTKGVLRGLHYQKCPFGQDKLIRCIKGAIFDVAVDIRIGSPTYGKWVGTILSYENKHMLFIPAGFAHGFVIYSDVAEVVYKTSCEYSERNDKGIIWNDPDIRVKWGFDKPLLSQKDSNLPLLKDADNNFIY